MSKLIVKLFIKDYQNTKSSAVREKYGILGSIAGIIINILLSVGKYLIGTITNSIAITADAVNNLTDATSSLITLVSFKMAGRKPDKDHPFGHGRIEYVAAVAVGFLVLLMGYELIKSSIHKILNPEEVVFSVPAVIVLVLSIFGKIWLALFNRYLGKQINSPVMAAVVTDSISDITATTITLIALIVSKFTSAPIDGYMGIVVSFFILYAGYGILKESINIILGAPPSKELVDELVEFIMSHEQIIGIHDLVIHSYGESRIFASIHAEIPADGDILDAHDTIDIIERKVKEKFGIELVVHMDPLVVNDEKVAQYHNIVHGALMEIDDTLNMHDFRVVEGSSHINFIFDILVPHSFKMSDKDLIDLLTEKIRAIDETYCIVVTIDNCYI